MYTPEQIYFSILNSNEIGYFNVVFTPIETFDNLQTVSKFKNIESNPHIVKILNDIPLQKKDINVYSHDWTYDLFEMKKILTDYGFNFDHNFQKHCENIFIIEYIPQTVEELKELGH